MSDQDDLTMDRLVDRFPNLGDRPALQSKIEGFNYIDEPNPLFVPPRLKITDPSESKDPTVLLISAPAAVGKSTFAKQLSARTGAPLWDLSHFQVGSHSFEGTLATAYGMRTASDILDYLEAGEFVLVMDALDEGQLRAGNENFLAFLDDLTQSLAGAAGGLALVAFARPDAADDLLLNCLENEVDLARYQIDYFAQDQAFEFIDLHLDAICDREDESSTHRHHREPFEQARDSLVDLVVRLLEPNVGDPWGSEVVRGFLGYAPVLEAISRYLRVDNPSSLQTDLDAASEAFGDGERAHLWDFLATIVESVMEREQEKVQQNLRPRLQEQAEKVNFTNWEAVYSQEEQRLRLLHTYVLDSNPPHLPEEVPPALRAQYEEHIATSVSVHPFIGHQTGEFANVVFRDYLFAKTLAKEHGQAGEKIRSEMSGQNLLTPLFGRFLLTFAGNGEEPEIYGDDFPYLYESLRSESRDDTPIHLTLQQAPDTDTAIGVMAAEGEVTPDVRFRLNIGDSGVRFLRRLSHAEINMDCRLTFGTEGGSFSLGPSVKVNCSSFCPAADTIQIRTTSSSSERGPDVLIISEAYQSSGSSPDIRPRGNGEIGVHWPGIAYPWVKYRLDVRPADDVDDDRLVAALTRFSNILTFFRSYGYGELGRRTTTINDAAVGESQLAQELLEYLLEDGLIRQQGQFFQLDTDRLDAHGITWSDVRNRRMSDGIRRLLTDFVRSRSSWR